jgi:glutathione S-transferase
MLTIHGVPLSVHTRKVLIVALLKNLNYKLEVVVPIVPDSLPQNWSTLSPTGLIPVLQDGGQTLADSSAICLYLEKKHPAPPVLPTATGEYGRALWFDAFAGGSIFRHLVHPLFVQTVVNPNIRKLPGDRTVIEGVLNDVRPKLLDYLESQIDGAFLAGNAMTLGDIAIASNFINYQYIGYRLDAGRHPKLVAYLKGILRTDVFREALEQERPFVAQMGLDRSFLD